MKIRARRAPCHPPAGGVRARQPPPLGPSAPPPIPMAASPDPLRDRLLAGLGVLVLGLPGALSLGVDAAERTEEFRVREKRPPARVPGALALEQRPSAWAASFADGLGLRTPLLRLRGLLHWSLLGESPGDQMVRGWGDWLYRSGDGALDAWRGADPLTEDAVEDWVAHHLARQREVEALGARYAVCIAPSKAAVYPEGLPDRFVRVGPSRRDQVLQRLREAGVEVVDLLPGMLVAKSSDREDLHEYLYHHDGTHWSWRGDRVADALLRAELGLQPPFATWHREEGTKGYRDSWERRLYLDGLIAHGELEWAPRQRNRGEKVPGRALGSDHRSAEPRRPRIVVLSDSYGPGVAELLGFDHPVRNLWDYAFDHGRLVEFEPDLVLALFVERIFEWVEPRMIPFFEPGVLGQLFEAGEEAGWRLGGGGDGRFRVAGSTPVPQPLVEAHTAESPGPPLLLILEDLPPLDGPAVLRVELECDRAAAVEVASFAPSASPEARRQTQRYHFPEGRRQLDVAVSEGPLAEGGRVTLWLDGGAATWRIHGAVLRRTGSWMGGELPPR